VKKLFRTGWRLVWIALIFLSAYLDFFFRIWLAGKASSIPERARYMQRWSRQFLRVFNCTVTAQGSPPAAGILVSNHLSYLDVIVFGSIRPFVFLSKREVRSWPVVGLMTCFAGTLYIQRQDKAEIVRLGAELQPVVEAGVPVVMFLEGTSSGGDQVLPFGSGLLSSVEKNGWPACAAWIHYSMPEGSVSDEICYWRDMTFFPHLLNLLSRESFRAYVSFDTPLTAKLDRKEMARELHARVCRLKDEHLGGEAFR
jgi:1-acyl-sn-glycerol-3-phosphate acyltransferase